MAPSPWTHALCPWCYEEREPGRDPVVIAVRSPEVCCGCGIATRSGIYYRADPASMRFCEHPG